MSRTPLVIGNWKLNPPPDDAISLATACAGIARSTAGRVDVGVAVPFPYLPGVADAVAGSPLRVGAQDVSPHDSGAHTGEVSAAMIAAWGDFAIVGHSERREDHGESDDLIASKLRALLRHGLTAVLCVGETHRQRETGNAEAVVAAQLAAATQDIAEQDSGAIVVAYEPVWAIGTGVSAAPDDAAAMATSIRQVLNGVWPSAGSIRILYGGSVSPANSREYLELPSIDGALVGGASLQPESFAAIVRSAVPTTT